MAAVILPFPRHASNDDFDFDPVPPPASPLRARVEALVERLIDMLDAIDGDVDLEEQDEREPEDDLCEAGDDGCGPVSLGWGRIGWGSAHDEEDTEAVYGIDQSQGPILGHSYRYVEAA